MNTDLKTTSTIPVEGVAIISPIPRRRARSYAFSADSPIRIESPSSKTTHFIPKESALFFQQPPITENPLLTKAVKKPLSKHSHIKDLNILTFYQENIACISESVFLKIISDIFQEDIDDIYCTLETPQQILLNYIQSVLNIPIQTSSTKNTFIYLPGLLRRSKSIDILTKILIKYLNPEVIKEIESSVDFICIFPRLNINLSLKHASTLLIKSSFDNLLEAATHYHPPFSDFSRQIQEWIIHLDNLLEVEELDLSNTHITSIPESICKLLTNIKKLNFQTNDCSSTSLLTNIESLTTLEELDLRDNSFKNLPPSFFNKLTSLQKLNLTKNLFPLEAIEEIRSTCIARNIQLSI